MSEIKKIEIIPLEKGKFKIRLVLDDGTSTTNVSDKFNLIRELSNLLYHNKL